jgi:hypothetical protein
MTKFIFIFMLLTSTFVWSQTKTGTGPFDGEENQDAQQKIREIIINIEAYATRSLNKCSKFQNNEKHFKHQSFIEITNILKIKVATSTKPDDPNYCQSCVEFIPCFLNKETTKYINMLVEKEHESQVYIMRTYGLSQKQSIEIIAFYKMLLQNYVTDK